MNRRTRQVLLWAMVPVALVLIGVLNYFAGGLAEPEESVTQTARLEFKSSELAKVYGSESVLELDWGSGSSSVALSQDADGEPISTLESIVAQEDGGFMLVDHPPAHIGARVRAYDENGRLLETVLTPAGSTLFTSVGDDRLAYVVAKQSNPNETLVVRDGSAETTYSVPLALNSGSILWTGDDIWVTATRTAFDTDEQKVTATQVTVPVTVGGSQVTDEQASEAVKEGWYAVGDELFAREQIVLGHGDNAQVTQTLRRESDASTLEIPGRSTPFGVDGSSLVYMHIPPEELGREVRRLPATYGSRTRVDEVLVGGFDGTAVGRIVVPGDVPTVGGWPRMDVTARGEVLAAVSTTQGVRIVRYKQVTP